MGEITIELNELYFFSFHGVFEEERKTGGEFVVDLKVKYAASENMISKIQETINYAELYGIVKTEMSKPRNLLETIAQTTAEKIYQAFPQSKEIVISIKKKNPPIINFSGNVAVKYSKHF